MPLIPTVYSCDVHRKPASLLSKSKAQEQQPDFHKAVLLKSIFPIHSHIVLNSFWQSDFPCCVPAYKMEDLDICLLTTHLPDANPPPAHRLFLRTYILNHFYILRFFHVLYGHGWHRDTLVHINIA